MFFASPLGDEQLKKRINERDEDLRGHYFRDTTAILHSYPFRRLKHKTQVFFAPRNDHICTRIEHVMHVATVATTICRALGLDPDLAWAIGLGHDLGHTPFGHLGEKIIGNLLAGEGGFRHEIYSLRVVDHLTGYGKGLNLTYAVRDGILNHCGEKFEKVIRPDFNIKNLSEIKTREYYPSSWEAVVVRMSDKIAYLGRDLEDAMQLHIVTPDQIPEEVRRILGEHNSDIINTLVQDVISYSLENGEIGFSNDIYETIIQLKEFNYKNIYSNPRLTVYHDYFERIIMTLFHYLKELFETKGFEIETYHDEKNYLAQRFGDFLKKMQHFYESEGASALHIVIDYIAGMTDDYSIDCVKEIMIPRKFSVQFDQIIPGPDLI
ncbi:MAG: HD domain-containing protein [Spirochaetales bacterium]|nr:HD domain-containing protein [Spirochaetales bacterium]